MNEIAVRLSAGGGVLARREHPDLVGHIDRLVRTKRLTAVYPGIYAASELGQDLRVRILGALLWAGPDAVLTGLAAAKVTYWPGAPVSELLLALPGTRGIRPRPGVRIERRSIPDDLVVRRHGLVATRPSLTAVDLGDTRWGGEAIDQALRTRTATLGQMWDALHRQPGRVGNVARAALLRDSRDLPWSEAERGCHRLLRGAKIKGWKANQEVAGQWVDILFRSKRVILEIDGWEHHGDRISFESDRKRRNALVLAGYTVLNFTWRQLCNEPDWVLACVVAAVGR